MYCQMHPLAGEDKPMQRQERHVFGQFPHSAQTKPGYTLLGVVCDKKRNPGIYEGQDNCKARVKIRARRCGHAGHTDAVREHNQGAEGGGSAGNAAERRG